MKSTKIFFILFILLSSSIKSDSSIKENMVLAESFFEDNLYDLAIIEYKRINTKYPKNKYSNHISMKIADCYEKMGYYLKSINQYKSILVNEKNNWLAIFNISRINHMMGEYNESNNIIDFNLDNFQNGRLDSLIYVKACNYFALTNIDSSKINFSKINDLNLKNFAKKNILDINKFQKEKLKNPLIARRLNFIFPGLGYLYIDMPQTFISTFIIESLFLYATYQTNKNGYTIGTLIGALSFAGFYSGSIHGAWKYGVKYNNEIYRNSI